MTLKKSNFPDHNYFTDKMNDRKQQLSECATYISGKNFIPHHRSSDVVPYE